VKETKAREVRTPELAGPHPYRSMVLHQERLGKLRIAAMFVATVLAVVCCFWGSIRFHTISSEQTAFQAIGAFSLGALCWVAGTWLGRLNKADRPALRRWRIVVAVLTGVVACAAVPPGPAARRMMCEDVPGSTWCEPLPEVRE